MAERRMFAKTIVLSDEFLDMPLTTRCLYFTLGMLADDDGFVNSPKSIMRQCGSSQDDMNVLIAKRFVIAFESGVIVIKHWRINNFLRNDRYVETKYTEEKKLISVKENGAYTTENALGIPNNGIPNNGIPSIGKNSIGKNSIGNNNNGAFPTENATHRWIKPTVEEIAQYAEEKGYNVDAQAFYDHYESNGWMVGKTHMKKWKAAVANWNRSDYNNKKFQYSNKRGNRFG